MQQPNKSTAARVSQRGSSATSARSTLLPPITDVARLRTSFATDTPPGVTDTAHNAVMKDTGSSSSIDPMQPDARDSAKEPTKGEKINPITVMQGPVIGDDGEVADGEDVHEPSAARVASLKTTDSQGIRNPVVVEASNVREDEIRPPDPLGDQPHPNTAALERASSENAHRLLSLLDQKLKSWTFSVTSNISKKHMSLDPVTTLSWQGHPPMTHVGGVIDQGTRTQSAPANSVRSLPTGLADEAVGTCQRIVLLFEGEDLPLGSVDVPVSRSLASLRKRIGSSDSPLLQSLPSNFQFIRNGVPLDTKREGRVRVSSYFFQRRKGFPGLNEVFDLTRKFTDDSLHARFIAEGASICLPIIFLGPQGLFSSVRAALELQSMQPPVAIPMAAIDSQADTTLTTTPGRDALYSSFYPAYLVDFGGQSLLQRAAIKGAEVLVRDLLQYARKHRRLGELVNHQDNSGRTALHSAIEFRRHKVAFTILQEAAEVITLTLRDQHGNLALAPSSWRQHRDLYESLFLMPNFSIEVLIRATQLSIPEDPDGAQAERPFIVEPAHELRQIRQRGGGRRDIEHCSVIEMVFRDQVHQGNHLWVSSFLQIRTDAGNLGFLDRADVMGRTAAHYAVLAPSGNDEKLLRSLISGLVNLSIPDNLGRNVLHWACAKGKLPLIRLLLPFKSQLCGPDELGKTPLHLLAEGGFIEDSAYRPGVIELFKECGERFDLNGLTFLHVLCQRGSFKTVKELVVSTANDVPLTQTGKDPLTILLSCSVTPPQDVPSGLIAPDHPKAAKKRLHFGVATALTAAATSRSIELVTFILEKMKAVSSSLNERSSSGALQGQGTGRSEGLEIDSSLNWLQPSREGTLIAPTEKPEQGEVGTGVTQGKRSRDRLKSTKLAAVESRITSSLLLAYRALSSRGWVDELEETQILFLWSLLGDRWGNAPPVGHSNSRKAFYSITVGQLLRDNREKTLSLILYGPSPALSPQGQHFGSVALELIHLTSESQVRRIETGPKKIIDSGQDVKPEKREGKTASKSCHEPRERPDALESPFLLLKIVEILVAQDLSQAQPAAPYETRPSLIIPSSLSPAVWTAILQRVTSQFAVMVREMRWLGCFMVFDALGLDPSSNSRGAAHNARDRDDLSQAQQSVIPRHQSDAGRRSGLFIKCLHKAFSSSVKGVRLGPFPLKNAGTIEKFKLIVSQLSAAANNRDCDRSEVLHVMNSLIGSFLQLPPSFLAAQCSHQRSTSPPTASQTVLREKRLKSEILGRLQYIPRLCQLLSTAVLSMRPASRCLRSEAMACFILTLCGETESVGNILFQHRLLEDIVQAADHSTCRTSSCAPVPIGEGLGKGHDNAMPSGTTQLQPHTGVQSELSKLESVLGSLCAFGASSFFGNFLHIEDIVYSLLRIAPCPCGTPSSSTSQSKDEEQQADAAPQSQGDAKPGLKCEDLASLVDKHIVTLAQILDPFHTLPRELIRRLNTKTQELSDEQLGQLAWALTADDWNQILELGLQRQRPQLARGLIQYANYEQLSTIRGRTLAACIANDLVLTFLSHRLTDHQILPMPEAIYVPVILTQLEYHRSVAYEAGAELLEARIFTEKGQRLMQQRLKGSDKEVACFPRSLRPRALTSRWSELLRGMVGMSLEEQETEQDSTQLEKAKDGGGDGKDKDEVQVHSGGARESLQLPNNVVAGLFAIWKYYYWQSTFPQPCRPWPSISPELSPVPRTLCSAIAEPVYASIDLLQVVVAVFDDLLGAPLQTCLLGNIPKMRLWKKLFDTGYQRTQSAGLPIHIYGLRSAVEADRSKPLASRSLRMEVIGCLLLLLGGEEVAVSKLLLDDGLLRDILRNIKLSASTSVEGGEDEVTLEQESEEYRCRLEEAVSALCTLGPNSFLGRFLRPDRLLYTLLQVASQGNGEATVGSEEETTGPDIQEGSNESPVSSHSSALREGLPLVDGALAYDYLFDPFNELPALLKLSLQNSKRHPELLDPQCEALVPFLSHRAWNDILAEALDLQQIAFASALLRGANNKRLLSLSPRALLSCSNKDVYLDILTQSFQRCAVQFPVERTWVPAVLQQLQMGSPNLLRLLKRKELLSLNGNVRVKVLGGVLDICPPGHYLDRKKRAVVLGLIKEVANTSQTPQGQPLHNAAELKGVSDDSIGEEEASLWRTMLCSHVPYWFPSNESMVAVLGRLVQIAKGQNLTPEPSKSSVEAGLSREETKLTTITKVLDLWEIDRRRQQRVLLEPSCQGVKVSWTNYARQKGRKYWDEQEESGRSPDGTIIRLLFEYCEAERNFKLPPLLHQRLVQATLLSKASDLFFVLFKIDPVHSMAALLLSYGLLSMTDSLAFDDLIRWDGTCVPFSRTSEEQGNVEVEGRPPSWQGWTAMHSACLFGRLDLAKRLIQDLGYGESSIVVPMLLQQAQLLKETDGSSCQGSLIRARSSACSSALALAANSGNQELVELLLMKLTSALVPVAAGTHGMLAGDQVASRAVMETFVQKLLWKCSGSAGSEPKSGTRGQTHVTGITVGGKESTNFIRDIIETKLPSSLAHSLDAASWAKLASLMVMRNNLVCFRLCLEFFLRLSPLPALQSKDHVMKERRREQQIIRNSWRKPDPRRAKNGHSPPPAPSSDNPPPTELDRPVEPRLPVEGSQPIMEKEGGGHAETGQRHPVSLKMDKELRDKSAAEERPGTSPDLLDPNSPLLIEILPSIFGFQRYTFLRELCSLLGCDEEQLRSIFDQCQALRPIAKGLSRVKNFLRSLNWKCDSYMEEDGRRSDWSLEYRESVQELEQRIETALLRSSALRHIATTLFLQDKDQGRVGSGKLRSPLSPQVAVLSTLWNRQKKRRRRKAKVRELPVRKQSSVLAGKKGRKAALSTERPPFTVELQSGESAWDLIPDSVVADGAPPERRPKQLTKKKRSELRRLRRREKGFNLSTMPADNGTSSDQGKPGPEMPSEEAGAFTADAASSTVAVAERAPVIEPAAEIHPETLVLCPSSSATGTVSVLKATWKSYRARINEAALRSDNLKRIVLHHRVPSSKKPGSFVLQPVNPSLMEGICSALEICGKAVEELTLEHFSCGLPRQVREAAGPGALLHHLPSLVSLTLDAETLAALTISQALNLRQALKTLANLQSFNAINLVELETMDTFHMSAIARSAVAFPAVSILTEWLLETRLKRLRRLCVPPQGVVWCNPLLIKKFDSVFGFHLLSFGKTLAMRHDLEVQFSSHPCDLQDLDLSEDLSVEDNRSHGAQGFWLRQLKDEEGIRLNPPQKKEDGSAVEAPRDGTRYVLSIRLPHIMAGDILHIASLLPKLWGGKEPKPREPERSGATAAELQSPNPSLRTEHSLLSVLLALKTLALEDQALIKGPLTAGETSLLRDFERSPWAPLTLLRLRYAVYKKTTPAIGEERESSPQESNGGEKRFMVSCADCILFTNELFSLLSSLGDLTLLVIDLSGMSAAYVTYFLRKLDKLEHLYVTRCPEDIGFVRSLLSFCLRSNTLRIVGKALPVSALQSPQDPALLQTASALLLGENRDGMPMLGKPELRLVCLAHGVELEGTLLEGLTMACEEAAQRTAANFGTASSIASTEVTDGPRSFASSAQKGGIADWCWKGQELLPDDAVLRPHLLPAGPGREGLQSVPSVTSEPPSHLKHLQSARSMLDDLAINSLTKSILLTPISLRMALGLSIRYPESRVKKGKNVGTEGKKRRKAQERRESTTTRSSKSESKPSSTDSTVDVNRKLKVMFVGLGEVGKTSLMRALMSKRMRAEGVNKDARTVGIDLHPWKVTKPSPMEIQFWDFAGQKIYYTTHQFFLTNNAVYLLVWKMHTPLMRDQTVALYSFQRQRQRKLQEWRTLQAQVTVTQNDYYGTKEGSTKEELRDQLKALELRRDSLKSALNKFEQQQRNLMKIVELYGLGEAIPQCSRCKQEIICSACAGGPGGVPLTKSPSSAGQDYDHDFSQGGRCAKCDVEAPEVVFMESKRGLTHEGCLVFDRQIGDWLSKLQIRVPGCTVFLIGTHVGKKERLLLSEAGIKRLVDRAQQYAAQEIEKNFSSFRAQMDLIIKKKMVTTDPEELARLDYQLQQLQSYPPVQLASGGASYLVDSIEGLGVSELKQAMLKALRASPLFEKQYPKTWTALRDRISKEVETKGTATLTLQQVKQFAQLQGMRTAEVMPAIRFFHELGDLLYFEDLSDHELIRDTIFLRSDWIIGVMKQLLNHDPGQLIRAYKEAEQIKAIDMTRQEKEEQRKQAQQQADQTLKRLRHYVNELMTHGILHQDLMEYIWAGKQSEVIELIVELLKAFDIIVDDGSGRLLVPPCLQDAGHLNVDPDAFELSSNVFRCRFVYPNVPDGLLYRIIGRSRSFFSHVRISPVGAVLFKDGKRTGVFIADVKNIEGVFPPNVIQREGFVWQAPATDEPSPSSMRSHGQRQIHLVVAAADKAHFDFIRDAIFKLSEFYPGLFCVAELVPCPSCVRVNHGLSPPPHFFRLAECLQTESAVRCDLEDKPVSRAEIIPPFKDVAVVSESSNREGMEVFNILQMLKGTEVALVTESATPFKAEKPQFKPSSRTGQDTLSMNELRFRAQKHTRFHRCFPEIRFSAVVLFCLSNGMDDQEVFVDIHRCAEQHNARILPIILPSYRFSFPQWYPKNLPGLKTVLFDRVLPTDNLQLTVKDRIVTHISKFLVEWKDTIVCPSCMARELPDPGTFLLQDIQALATKSRSRVVNVLCPVEEKLVSISLDKDGENQHSDQGELAGKLAQYRLQGYPCPSCIRSNIYPPKIFNRSRCAERWRAATSQGADAGPSSDVASGDIENEALTGMTEFCEDEGVEVRLVDILVPEIFLSYSWGEKIGASWRTQQVVKKVKAEFEDVSDFLCWLDVERMGVGQDMDQEMRRGVQQAQVVIVFLDAQYVRSHNCIKEFCYAMFYRKHIQLVILSKDQKKLADKKNGAAALLEQQLQKEWFPDKVDAGNQMVCDFTDEIIYQKMESLRGSAIYGLQRSEQELAEVIAARVGAYLRRENGA